VIEDNTKTTADELAQPTSTPLGMKPLGEKRPEPTAMKQQGLRYAM
jgi:hypothetical protein